MANSKRRPASPAKVAAAKEALEGLHQSLIAGVEAVQTSEDWTAALNVAAKFHHYSANNVFLIYLQRRDATQVASYRKWTELGRQVRAGEKSIRILAPVLVNRLLQPGDQGYVPGLDIKRQVLVGFKGVPVFDISQTDGPDLPTIAPTQLDGDAPTALWEAVKADLESKGWTVERGDCGQANGYTDGLRRVVRVREGVAPLQALKTLVHEWAHATLHFDAENPESVTARHRGVEEVEAESVAYVVLGALGFDTARYSFKYVAGWATQAEPKVVLATADKVIKAAHKLVTTITEKELANV